VTNGSRQLEARLPVSSLQLLEMVLQWVLAVVAVGVTWGIPLLVYRSFRKRHIRLRLLAVIVLVPLSAYISGTAGTYVVFLLGGLLAREAGASSATGSPVVFDCELAVFFPLLYSCFPVFVYCLVDTLVAVVRTRRQKKTSGRP